MTQWNMPVEPDELLYALKVCNAAALNQIPMANTPGQVLEVVDEDTGNIHTIRFVDNAVNRFGVAIAREFDNMGSKFFSLMTRIGALMRLLDKIVAAIMGPKEESGPRTRIGDGPATA